MLSKDAHYYNSGFTIVEMMIAMLVGTILLGGIVTLYSTTLSHSKTTLDITRLNQDLQSSIALISDDIRRAGYWGNATSDIGTGTNNNPFMVTGSTDIRTNAGNDCILLSYDSNADGLLSTLNTANDDERYGYRISNGILQARPADAPFSCTASQASWVNITDPNIITVTGLTFTNTNTAIDIDGAGPNTSTINLRNVAISISGQLANDNTVSKTLTHTVKVRNDKFVP